MGAPLPPPPPPRGADPATWWTVGRRTDLVLALLRGDLDEDEACRRHGLSAETVAEWRARFLAGARAGLEEPQRAPARWGRRVYDSIADAAGETPLVRLRRVVADLPGQVFAKCEFMNPMGSAKDRVARHMVRAAAGDGRLAPGDVLVEASSGNTAMGLGMMAVLGGYGCKVVVRDRTSAEKRRALEALGVELEVVDGSLPPEHPESYNRVMERVVRDTARCYFPDQHNNRENNAAHYATTGPELWEQMEGRIDVLVAGMGTGGTISGVARYLKERDPSIKVVGVDVEGSIFSEYFRTGRVGASGPYLLEGLGDEAPIACPEFEFIDAMVQVSDREAFRWARALSRQEAVFAGGSSGAALWGVRQVLADLGRADARVVTILPDGGARYLSTIYDDAWLAARGLLDDVPPVRAAA